MTEEEKIEAEMEAVFDEANALAERLYEIIIEKDCSPQTLRITAIALTKLFAQIAASVPAPDRDRWIWALIALFLQEITYRDAENWHKYK